MTGRTQKLLVVLGIVAFVTFLAWTTVSSQKVECQICVEFGNGRNCATASAVDEKSAAENAQTTACGPLASGMDATIACGNAVPASRQCRGT
jgi:hypothetical protein